MADHSPDAQAVLDAVNGSSAQGDGYRYTTNSLRAAAALRAAADQVVPEEAPPADFLDHPVAAEIDQRRVTRAQLLAIADELEQS